MQLTKVRRLFLDVAAIDDSYICAAERTILYAEAYTAKKLPDNSDVVVDLVLCTMAYCANLQLFFFFSTVV